MKRLICFSIVLILCCLVSSYVSYGIGKQHAITAKAASAIITFDALKKLKAGKFSKASSELEIQCFANSADVLSESGWRSTAFRKIMVTSLITYRHTYRTNSAEWTPMEQRLEILLAQKQ
jgi:hypothetical protein